MTTEKLTFEVNAELVRENERLKTEITQLKEALGELIPIASDRLFSIPVKSLEGVQESVDRARKLLTE